MRAHRTQIGAVRDLYRETPLDFVGKPDTSKAEEMWTEHLLQTDRFFGANSSTQYAKAYVAFRSRLRLAHQAFSTSENIKGSGDKPCAFPPVGLVSMARKW